MVVAVVAGTGLALIPVHLLGINSGAILVAFGQGWARSVTRYHGGTRREAKGEEERIRERLAGREGRMGWDIVALATAFKSALLESLESTLLVVALGAARINWSSPRAAPSWPQWASSPWRSRSGARWSGRRSSRPGSWRRCC